MRMGNQAADFAIMARDVVQWSARLRDETGWLAPCLDLGGGWTYGRKEKTGPRGGVDDETEPVNDFETPTVSIY